MERQRQTAKREAVSVNRPSAMPDPVSLMRLSNSFVLRTASYLFYLLFPGPADFN